MSLIIGSHVSFSKDEQLIGSVKEALSYKASTFMFYTGAPQNTMRLPIDTNLTKQGQDLMRENGIDINNVVVHAPYIINMANDKNFDFNVSFLSEEIKRVTSLGVKLLVIHPGSHVNLGEEVGLDNIVKVLNAVIKEDTYPMICLETMAGKGSELGYNFNQLKYIIDNIKIANKVFVCMDTCHLNDAGYDLTDFDNILKQFDEIIGLDKLKVIHINDSKNEINTHKDRHENIGLGTIGFKKLNYIVNHEKLKDIPKILETPYISYEDQKYPPYLFEIDMLRKQEENNNLINDIASYYK